MPMKHAWPWIAVLLISATPVAVDALNDAAQKQIIPGMEELVRLDWLPAFKSAVKVGSVSSYDRSGGNDDGFSGKYSFVSKEPEGLVLADLKGPGVIYRIWTPTPSDEVLEFLFDGETTPRITLKFRDLFLGGHASFPRPLVGFGAGGFYSYVPIPFAQSCKVRMRARLVQFYQINYAIYSSDTPIQTFHANPSADDLEQRNRACQLFASSGNDISAQVTPPGAKASLAQAAVRIQPGQTQTVFESKKPGRLLGLRLAPAEALAGKARSLLLRISFDGAAPAVNCPAGDFFGYAWGQPAMRSLLAGVHDGLAYCYFPMPFDRSARIEIVSEGSTPVDLRVEVWHAPVPRSAREGKFYALWRRENPTTSGVPFTFIATSGRGHLVGTVLQAQGFESGKTLFFEGDDQTTIDGELAIHGTGSEDYFNGGWYDVPDRWEKRMSFPLSGCLGYAKHLGRTGGYRMMIGDKYAYSQSIRHVMEHAGEKNSIPTDYCSVTYLYSERPPPAGITVPPLKDRAVNDLSEVIFPAWWQIPINAWSFSNATLARKREKLGNEEVRYLSLSVTGNDWFGPHFLSVTCDVPAAGVYEVQIETLKGPSQARVQLFQNENPSGDPVDLYAEQPAKSGRLSLGKLELAEGKNPVMLKLVGKNDKSSGLGLDLIQVICIRK